MYKEFFMPDSEGILDETVSYVVDCVDTYVLLQSITGEAVKDITKI